MALVPDDPKQRNAAVAALLVVVLFVLFWTQWYSGASAAVADLQAHSDSLAEQTFVARTLFIRGDAELQAQVAEYERHVQRLEQLIPQTEDVAYLIADFDAEARRAGVALTTLNPQPQEDIGFYARKTYEVGVVGDYHNIGRFLTAIASLPRIITPVDLDLAPVQGGNPDALAIQAQFPLEAQLYFQTYIVPDTPPAPPAGAAEGQGGG